MAVDEQYTYFCAAAESVWAQRQCDDIGECDTRRGWPIETKEVALAPARPEGWGKDDVGLTAWQALSTRVVNYNGVRRKRRWDLYEESLKDLHYHLQRVRRLMRQVPHEEDVLSSLAAMDGTNWTPRGAQPCRTGCGASLNSCDVIN